MSDLRQAAQMALEALELGYDFGREEAARYHERMAGYKQAQHDKLDAEVAQIASAISALRAALAAVQEPVALDLRAAYVLACDLVPWANAADTVVGDPARTYDTAVKLRDCLGKMPVGTQPVAPAGWLPSEDKAREAFWGCYPETGNGDKADVWMTAFRWCRAMLAAAPTAPAAQPLTDEQIENLCAEACASASEAGDLDLQPIHLARAIERAHGIGGGQ